MLSEKTKQAIEKLQKSYPEKRSALLPALHLAQAEAGYLSKDVQAEVAALFDIAPNEVNSVVTFYDMFFEKPVGKHCLHVCKNISCMLRGGDELLQKLCQRLDIAPGGTTSDGEFTVIPSECLGACDRAPMILVDDHVEGPIEEKDLENLLAEAKKGHGHSSPVEHEEAEHA
jgi:NADH-quinone oxidoreductase subunit E